MNLLFEHVHRFYSKTETGYQCKKQECRLTIENGSITNLVEHLRLASHVNQFKEYNSILLRKKAALLSSVIMIIAVALFSFIPGKKECDIENPDNRLFKVYYGLKDVQLPFNASAENNKNAELFEQSINGNINAPSIIVNGEFGSGKSHLLNYKLAKYDPNSTLIIKLLGNKKLFKYLTEFVNNQEVKPMNFSRNDFIDIIMAELVDGILRIDKSVLEKEIEHLKQFEYDERRIVSFLLLFYSNNENSGLLLNLIKILLHEKSSPELNLNCAIETYDAVKNVHEKTYEYTDLKEKLVNPFNIYDGFQKNQIAQQTYCIMKSSQTNLGFVMNFFKENSKNTHITTLSNFLKKAFHKRLVLVVDSLDENSHFFNKDMAYLETLQTFIDSVINPELLALTLGGEDESVFDLLIFLPFIKGIKINWEKTDKIPIIRIEWDKLKLLNYIDFILNNLRKKQHHGCKSVPTFEQLLGSNRDLVDDVLGKLRQPRDLHIFMNFLIETLQKNVIAKLYRDTPFVADRDIVNQALEKAKLQFNKYSS